MQKPVLTQAIDFFKSPKFPFSKKSFKSKVSSIFQLWALQSLLIFIAGVLTAWALTSTPWSGENLVESQSQVSIWGFFIMAIVIAPTLEELAFRGWITSRRFVSTLSVIVLIYFSYGIIDNTISNSLFSKEALLGVFLAFIITIPILVYSSLKHPFSRLKLKQFFSHHLGKVIYSSSLLFAIIHLGNYTHLEEIWFLAPLLVLPQFIGGLNLAYIRTQFGLGYSIATHTLTNLLPFLILLPSSYLSNGVKQIYLANNLNSVTDLSQSDQYILFTISLIVALYFILIISLSVYSVIQFFKYKAYVKSKTN